MADARHSRTVPYLVAPFVLLVAGCGGALSDSSGPLQVDAGTRALRTGDQLRLATTGGAGDPSAIRWRILSSNNAPALGSGTISADGIYTPPATLSRDLVSVTIQAAGQDAAPGAIVTTTLSVTPGFVQPLQPENAALPPGTTIDVRAQIAEVGGGAVTWRLESAASNANSDASLDASARAGLGTLANQHCEHGTQKFTTCTVSYTAPPAGSQPPAMVWLVAMARESGGQPPVTTRARLLLSAANGISSNPTLHQVEQTGTVFLGGSGGNDNDFDTYQAADGTRFVADCCGGTLGALVQDGAGMSYILSNNHVLAESDQAQPGDTIEQPGLIDDGCAPLSRPGAQLAPIATLRYIVPLKSEATNVDAALAAVHPGAVDSSGSILELGDPSGLANAGALSPASPAAGNGEVLDAAHLDSLSVVKSGRTTGLTCSTVDAVDLRVQVDYYKDCAETEPYTTKMFTGQIGIGGDAFADSGDSGALVLDAKNARAVGLLYATGTTGPSSQAPGTGLSLANPIRDVLDELSAQAGTSLAISGTSTPHPIACLNYGGAADAARPTVDTLAADERARTASALEQAQSLRSANSHVLAVAAGASADEPGRGAVLVYTDGANSALPASVLGVPTVVIPSDLATIARGLAAWPAPTISPGLNLVSSSLAAAKSTADRLAPQIMQGTAIFGVGVAQSLDDPAQPALLLLLDRDAPQLATLNALHALSMPGPDQAAADDATLPANLGGMRVRYLPMHRFRVTQSKYVPRGTPSSCAPRALATPGWKRQGENDLPWQESPASPR
jgi:hypothetical protein